jgi:hypothetical protein
MDLFILCGQTWAIQESPITLHKIEGSKSFDFEISQINNEAIYTIIKNYGFGVIRFFN